MSLKSVSKDMGEAWCRLFDHRPVITAEINYFLKQFEENRKDREQARLQKTYEHIREIDECLIGKAVIDLDKSLSSILANVSTAQEMCQMVLERENERNKDDWLTENRKRRVKKWTAFMDDMCEESAKVDAKFKDDSAAVIQHYQEIEEKLHLNS